MCLFSGYEHHILRAVVAPADQVNLGLCIPEVEQLGACFVRMLEGGNNNWPETCFFLMFAKESMYYLKLWYFEFAHWECV